MKKKLLLSIVFITAPFAFGRSPELLNASNVRYSFEINERACAYLQDLIFQKSELSKQLLVIATQGEEVLQAESLQASDGVEKAIESFQALQKKNSSITSTIRDIDQKILEESNTRGGLRLVDYVSTQEIPQQSEIFYTDITSFPTVPLQFQPSILGYRTDIKNNRVTATSILSKGYACLLLSEGLSEAQYPTQMMIAQPTK